MHGQIRVCMDRSECARMDLCVHGWIHMCMDGSMCAQMDPRVHKQIHLHRCAGGICECTDRSMHRAVRGSVRGWMQGQQSHATSPIPGSGIFLFAGCLCSRRLEVISGHEVIHGSAKHSALRQETESKLPHKHSGMLLQQGMVTMGPRVGDSHHIRACREQRDLLPRAGNAAGVAEGADGFSWS